MHVIPLLQGMLLGASFCVSVGPQSLFVLRQGIRGEAGLLVASICILVDFALIAAAITGAGVFVDAVPRLQPVMSWATAGCILAYGCFALRAIWRSGTEHRDDAAGSAAPTVVGAILGALVLSLLNPQVYMEVMVTVGLVGLHFPYEDRWLFGLGAAAVSPLWFFGLVFGGRRATRHFGSARVRRVLDGVAGLTMIGFAVALVCAELGRT